MACGSNTTSLVYEIMPILTISKVVKAKDSSASMLINTINKYNVTSIKDDGTEVPYSIDYYHTNVGSNAVVLSSALDNFFAPSVCFFLIFLQFL